MPLPRKRVLVTRAAHQASALGDALAARGLTVVAIPSIAIEPPTDGYASLHREIRTLEEFDWVLFTSANAVDVFASELDAMSVHDLPCRIGSIGTATSRALKSAGLQVDLQSPVAVSEAFAAAITPRLHGGRVLLVQAESARDVLPTAIKQAGAEVVVAHAYRTVVPLSSIHALREEMPRLHAITFTSSSSVRNVLELSDAASVTLPPGVVLASIGPITSQTLREAGYQPQVEAATADVEVLASSLARYLERI